jgi:hypothetical protein
VIASSPEVEKVPQGFNPFWQNLISTFVGATFGFIFSLALFYVTRKVAERSSVKNLRRNLDKEFEFNIHYLRGILDELNKIIEKITADSRNIWLLNNYDEYQRLFTQVYAQQGLAYEKLTPKEMSQWNKVLVHMAQGTALYLQKELEKWKTGRINKQEIIDTFTFERNNINDYVTDTLPEIKNKLLR